MEDNKVEVVETTTVVEKTPKKKKTAGQIVKTVTNILAGVFFLLAIFMVLTSVLAKNNNNEPASLFGYEMRTVLTGSMEKGAGSKDVSDYKIKHIKAGAVVFIKKVPDDKAGEIAFFDDIKVGDVLTFQYVVGAEPKVITHRVIEIRVNTVDGGYDIDLEGDNRDVDQNLGIQTIKTGLHGYTTSYIIGKVVGQNYILGRILTWAATKEALIFTIIIPCGIIIIFQIFKIASLSRDIRDEKRKEETERKSLEVEEKNRELEEMKKKLAALEAMNKKEE